MAAMISILVLVVFLSGAGAAVFVMLVVGIHMDERHSKRMAHSRRTRVECVARRLLCADMPDGNPRRDQAGRS